MIDNSAYIKELADANKCRLESVRKSLKDAPRGTLCIRMRESGIYFTRHLGDKEKGITKRPDLVVELMRKRKLFAEEKSLSDTQEILDTIYEQLREIEKRKLATSRIPIEAIESVGVTLTDVSEPVEVFRWLKSNQNSFKEKELKFVTNNGVRVRSKSEKIIGDKLEELGIPYIYEASLRLPNGRYFSPDFTLLSLRNELKYWEHFGLLGDEKYDPKFLEKMKEYSENGITPGKNLILSFEWDISHPENLERLIMQALL